jgi:hypothetical protein
MSEVSLAELARKLKPYIVQTVIEVSTSPSESGGSGFPLGFQGDAGIAYPNTENVIHIVGGGGMASTSAGGSTITIATSTPGTLAYDSISQNIPAHTHAVTTSFEPGVNPSILRSGAAGELYLGVTSPTRQAQFVVHPATVNTKGQIIEALAGQLANLWQLYDSAGNDLIIVNNDGDMESGNPSFASGVSGWRITHAGDAEFNNITSRGSIKASVFEYGDIQATAGSHIVSKSASKLHADWTSPASVGASNTMDVDDDTSDTWLFAVGDLLRIKTLQPTGVAQVWVTVNSRVDNTGYTTYNVTLESGDTSTLFSKGTGIVDYGQSGDGAIYLSADGVIGAAVNMSIVDFLIGVVSTVTINNGGSGYTEDDVLTIVQAGSSGTAQVVVGVTAGVVTSIKSISDGGYDYDTATGLSTTGGTGTGCTLNITDTDNPWEGSQYLKARIGNMNGAFGTGSNDRYGFGVGDYDAGNYISYNAELPNTFLLSAGDGAVSIDEDGFHIQVNNQYYDQTGIRWHTSGATVTHYIRALHDTSGQNTTMQIRAIGVAPQKNNLWLEARGTSTALQSVFLQAVNGSYTASIVLTASSASGNIDINVNNRVQITGPSNVSPYISMIGAGSGNAFITLDGGIYVGGIVTSNPGVGVLRYTGDLSSRKQSTNYSVWAFHKLTTPVRILDVTNGNAVGPSSLVPGGLPQDIQAIACRVGFKEGSSGSNSYYFAIGPTSSNYYAIVCRMMGTANIWTENSGVVPCSSIRTFYYRAVGTAGNCSYFVDVYGYWI